ncbi:MAG: ATP-binding protein [Clostridia bacterium]|nr:ATP-binding protein [Clostridia bacterium]MBR6800969.1 ATP-binding protein [Eubacteriaceae bacterium]
MSNLKIITGHYGSGKTEVCVNLAMKYAKHNGGCIIADLDIVNPYFRSREKDELFLKNNVRLVANNLNMPNMTAEIPALSSELYGLIDNHEDRIIFDVGGDGNGSRVLSRFAHMIEKRDYDMYLVLNANRPFTRDADSAIQYISDINTQSRLKINGIINNTHLLRETSLDDIIRGDRLANEVSEKTGIPMMFNVIPERLEEECKNAGLDKFFVLEELYMRPDWL